MKTLKEIKEMCKKYCYKRCIGCPYHKTENCYAILMPKHWDLRKFKQRRSNPMENKCPECKNRLYADSDSYNDYPFRNSYWLACKNTDCNYSKDLTEKEFFDFVSQGG